MSFSDMKQIQNRVFRLSLVVHVKIGLIIRLHIIVSYSSLCICKIIFIQLFSSLLVLKQLNLQYAKSIETTFWEPYLYIRTMQFTNNNIYGYGPMATLAYLTFTNLHGLIYSHSTCLAEVFLPCATFKNIHFILVAFNKSTSSTIASGECT